MVFETGDELVAGIKDFAAGHLRKRHDPKSGLALIPHTGGAAPLMPENSQ